MKKINSEFIWKIGIWWYVICCWCWFIMFIVNYNEKKKMKVNKKKKIYLVKFDEVFDEIWDYNEEKIIFHICHIYDLFGLKRRNFFFRRIELMFKINLYELINDFSNLFVWKNLLNIDYNEMAMYLDEYVYDHEDHLVLQMSYHNKNIYEVFSRRKFSRNNQKKNLHKL